MNIQEIEEKITSPFYKKEFRVLTNINIPSLYKKLYSDGLLRGNNTYFQYNTRTQTITSILEDINTKIEEQATLTDNQDEMFCFIDHASSHILYLIFWYHPKNVSIDNVFKRAKRYHNLGAML